MHNTHTYTTSYQSCVFLRCQKNWARSYVRSNRKSVQTEIVSVWKFGWANTHRQQHVTVFHQIPARQYKYLQRKSVPWKSRRSVLNQSRPVSRIRQRLWGCSVVSGPGAQYDVSEWNQHRSVSDGIYSAQFNISTWHFYRRENSWSVRDIIAFLNILWLSISVEPWSYRLDALLMPNRKCWCNEDNVLHNTSLAATFQVNQGTPVRECLTSGFYWSYGWRR